MKTYLTSGFAAAIIASAAFAGTASAQQYEPYAESPPSLDDTQQLDTTSTGSIDGGVQYAPQSPTMSDTDIDGSQDPGDFYDGAQRPTN